MYFHEEQQTKSKKRSKQQQKEKQMHKPRRRKDVWLPSHDDRPLQLPPPIHAPQYNHCSLRLHHHDHHPRHHEQQQPRQGEHPFGKSFHLAWEEEHDDHHHDHDDC